MKIFKITSEVKRMTQKDLEKRNDFLERKCNALMLNNRALTEERNRLQAELDRVKSMSMFEFGNKYATSESLEAEGRAFAKALLGGA